MTTRISHLFVALEQDLRDDDVQPLIDAISHLRGVLQVTSGPSDGFHAAVNKARLRRELLVKIAAMINEETV